jgi:hypothetical protein
MDVSNDTPYDAKYKVSGGGTPVGPPGRFVQSEETSSWPVIAAGAVVTVQVTSKGPWRVYFYINGEGFIADSNSDNDQVHLVPTGSAFRVDVRKVAHATGRVVIPPKLAQSA